MSEIHTKAWHKATNSPRRILIVDDEQSIVKLLTDILRDAGYSCLGCSDGPQAMHMVKTQQFDAVLCDLHMAGMSGMDLLRVVREEHPHLAFIIITGESSLRFGVDAMKQGASDYLTKPLNIAAVQMSVQQVIERKEMEEQLHEYHEMLEEMVEQRTEQLRKALAKIEQNYEETLQALATALEMRDTGTAGHTRRVMTYAVQIAKTMECSREEVHSLTLAALLHDMGKIGIPDSILRKTTALTPSERAVMQSHVTRGYNLLRCVAFLKGAAEIVLTHHEHYDGAGYPQGLMGTDIPLGARIYAVADAIASMTSDRPYRWAATFAAARTEIIQQAGKQFDPTVVSAFLSIEHQTWEEMREGLMEVNNWEKVNLREMSTPLLPQKLHFLEAKPQEVN